MKIFDIDSPLMRVLGKAADLLVLNLLTLVMCIPIVTAGASLTAMHYCCLKMRQSTVIWLLFLAVVAFFGLDLHLMYINPTETSTFIFGGIIAALALLLFAGTMVFPIQAKFYNPIPKTLKTAFLFSFKHFPRTLLMLAVNLFPFSLFLLGNLGWMLLPLILCFCFSAPAFLAAVLYNKDFEAAEEAIRAKNEAKQTTTED